MVGKRRRLAGRVYLFGSEREAGVPQLDYSTIKSEPRCDRAGEVVHPPSRLL
jgi:hypothetical protein